MEPVSALVIAAGGMLAYRLLNRGKTHAQWKDVLEEAAKNLDGRASPGTRFDAPELRATIDQTTVTIKINAAHKSASKGVAVAQASLSEEAGKTRLYFGWDISSIPPELEYIPQLEGFSMPGLKGRMIVRADDAAFAREFLRHAANDLADVRREANAHGVEILLRGGTLRLAAHGIERSAPMIERLVTATSRLVRGVDFFAGASSGTPPPRGPSTVTDDARCELCTERRNADQTWMRCNRCGALYHSGCWIQATGCLADGCEETRATPA